MKKFSNDSEDSDEELTKCFKVSKRRSVRSINYAACMSAVDAPKDTDKDCLFPLRSHLNSGESNEDQPPLDTDVSSKQLQVAKNDIFIFGSNRTQEAGFSFKMGNFFRGIGNSVKSMFRKK